MNAVLFLSVPDFSQKVSDRRSLDRPRYRPPPRMILMFTMVYWTVMKLGSFTADLLVAYHFPFFTILLTKQ